MISTFTKRLALNYEHHSNHVNVILNNSNAGQHHHEVKRGGELLFEKLSQKMQKVSFVEQDKVFHPNDLIATTQYFEEKFFQNTNNTNPLIIAGGDHYSTVPLVAGFLKSGISKNPGVLWIDAHPDMNTKSSSPSGNRHGMSVAYLMGLELSHSLLTTGQFLKPENIAFVGLRSIDPFERRALDDLGIMYFGPEAINPFNFQNTIRQLSRKFSDIDGLHVSFDIDVLDPTIIKSTGTPVANGCAASDLFALSDFINGAFHHKLKSVDIVEFLPGDDGYKTYQEADLVSNILVNMVYQ